MIKILSMFLNGNDLLSDKGDITVVNSELDLQKKLFKATFEINNSSNASDEGVDNKVSYKTKLRYQKPSFNLLNGGTVSINCILTIWKNQDVDFESFNLELTYNEKRNQLMMKDISTKRSLNLAAAKLSDVLRFLGV